MTGRNSDTPDDLADALAAIDQLRTAVATHLDDARTNLDHACQTWSGDAVGPALAKFAEKWRATDYRVRDDLERIHDALVSRNSG